MFKLNTTVYKRLVRMGWVILHIFSFWASGTEFFVINSPFLLISSGVKCVPVPGPFLLQSFLLSCCSLSSWTCPVWHLFCCHPTPPDPCRSGQSISRSSLRKWWGSMHCLMSIVRTIQAYVNFLGREAVERVGGPAYYGWQHDVVLQALWHNIVQLLLWGCVMCTSIKRSLLKSLITSHGSPSAWGCLELQRTKPICTACIAGQIGLELWRQ